MFNRFAILALCLAASLCAPGAQAQDPNPPTLKSSRGAWKMTRQWTPAETRHYARWVENIYELKTKGSTEQRIAKLDDILADPQMNLLEQAEFRGPGSNPQLPASIIRMAHNTIDCAKLTSFMGAYYAYRRGLPWMVSYVRAEKGDVRTSPTTIPTGTSSTLDRSLSGFFTDVIQGFSSGNYRVPPNGQRAELSDTVPVAISKDFLMPGCLNYLDGHCLVLAKVDKYGELRFINASTTNTRDIFTYNGMNTVSGITPRGSEDDEDEWAGCFQGMRVYRYPIAETDKSGNVLRLRRRTDEEMKQFGYSLEQYDLLRQMYESQHIDEGDLKPTNFHDLIRLRMRSVDQISPLDFLEEYVDEILEVYQIREQFVQDAWADVQRNGPIVYPEGLKDENIFQAVGRWETWSSPSSDVDRRNKYFYMIEWVDYAIRWYGMMPTFVDLRGLEKYNIKAQPGLMNALRTEKQRLFNEHALEYSKSNGERVRLTLADIEARLYNLSFDPNHPPELRWGAPEGSEERASAPSRPTPVPGGKMIAMEDAYRWQTYYRHVGTRETEMSLLQGMFTEGFPVRSKFDEQLHAWLDYAESAPAAPEASEAAPEAVEEAPRAAVFF